MIELSMFSGGLRRLKDAGLLRTLTERASAQGPHITAGGRELINFASNDYLGLASDPRLIDAACRAAERYGFGAGASRLLGGGTPAHAQCERRAARLKGSEAALLFGSGYEANTGAIPALAAGEIFSDELNHASIIDGCRLARGRTHIYRHRDMGHLAELLSSSGAARKLVVTDTVFSMSGEIAPVRELCALCELHGAVLYLDDAHATGVLGAGALAHFGLRAQDWVVQMSTCSKALGGQGAFVAASADTVSWLVNSARSFIYSTAPSPAAAAAALAAIEILMSAEGERLMERLHDNRGALTDKLQRAGISAASAGTPIIPVFIGGIERTVAAAAALMERGIYAPAIRPPTVAAPMIRLTVTAAHSSGDIDTLVRALGETL